MIDLVCDIKSLSFIKINASEINKYINREKFLFKSGVYSSDPFCSFLSNKFKINTQSKLYKKVDSFDYSKEYFLKDIDKLNLIYDEEKRIRYKNYDNSDKNNYLKYVRYSIELKYFNSCFLDENFWLENRFMHKTKYIDEDGNRLYFVFYDNILESISITFLSNKSVTVSVSLIGLLDICNLPYEYVIENTSFYNQEKKYNYASPSVNIKTENKEYNIKEFIITKKTNLKMDVNRLTNVYYKYIYYCLYNNISREYGYMPYRNMSRDNDALFICYCDDYDISFNFKIFDLKETEIFEKNEYLITLTEWKYNKESDNPYEKIDRENLEIVFYNKEISRNNYDYTVSGKGKYTTVLL